MSEINHNAVNETEETTETNETDKNIETQKATLEKLNSLSLEEKEALINDCKQYKAEHPNATREELEQHVCDKLNNEKNETAEDGENAEDSETSEDDAHDPPELERTYTAEELKDFRKRSHELSMSQDLTEEDKQELKNEISTSKDYESVLTKYEELEKIRAKENKNKEDDGQEK